MAQYKTTLICLLLLIAICLPQSADTCPASNPPVECATGKLEGNSSSFANDNQGPRKKIKKKRRTPLNRKTKMKSGKHCPSF